MHADETAPADLQHWSRIKNLSLARSTHRTLSSSLKTGPACAKGPFTAMQNYVEGSAMAGRRAIHANAARNLPNPSAEATAAIMRDLNARKGAQQPAERNAFQASTLHGTSSPGSAPGYDNGDDYDTPHHRPGVGFADLHGFELQHDALDAGFPPSRSPSKQAGIFAPTAESYPATTSGQPSIDEAAHHHREQRHQPIARELNPGRTSAPPDRPFNLQQQSAVLPEMAFQARLRHESGAPADDPRPAGTQLKHKRPMHRPSSTSRVAAAGAAGPFHDTEISHREVRHPHHMSERLSPKAKASIARHSSPAPPPPEDNAYLVPPAGERSQVPRDPSALHAPANEPANPSISTVSPPPPLPPALPTPSLDYAKPDLFAMDFATLAEQPFDHDPTAPPPLLPHHLASAPTAQKMAYVKQLAPSQQAQFCTSLDAAAWDDAGQWFSDEFARLRQRQSGVRRAKRDLAVAAERAVAARYRGVVEEREALAAVMQQLRSEGSQLVRLGTPRARDATRGRAE